jgi:hypothetical protein
MIWGPPILGNLHHMYHLLKQSSPKQMFHNFPIQVWDSANPRRRIGLTIGVHLTVAKCWPTAKSSGRQQVEFLGIKAEMYSITDV